MKSSLKKEAERPIVIIYEEEWTFSSRRQAVHYTSRHILHVSYIHVYIPHNLANLVNIPRESYASKITYGYSINLTQVLHAHL